VSGDKKRQKRGGRGNVKAKQKKEPDIVRLARIPRGKRKFVTRVTGLGTFGEYAGWRDTAFSKVKMAVVLQSSIVLHHNHIAFEIQTFEYVQIRVFTTPLG